MTIGIDASRAFVKNKTGIEEYSYQVIKHLRTCLGDESVVLYLDPRVNKSKYIDFELPKKWKTKFLGAAKFWTQVRLSLEVLFLGPKVLFVPAHTVPFIHSRQTIVTIHGLEYEFCPKAYSPFERLYMRWSIRKSCQWASRIIAVSENTKKDLIRMYNVPENKIDVIYEGYNNFELKTQNSKLKTETQNLKLLGCGYLLFIGRLEERKNIIGTVEAFEILKKKYNIPHKLILVGKYGYGGEKIKSRIYASECKNDIILTGYISNEEKYYLLRNADAFIFATFYEGFGLPILEAQNVGVPVVASNNSSVPEVAGGSTVLVDPENVEEIAKATHKLLSDEDYKNDIIRKGLENVKRFSWENCAERIAKIIQTTNDRQKNQ